MHLIAYATGVLLTSKYMSKDPLPLIKEIEADYLGDNFYASQIPFEEDPDTVIMPCLAFERWGKAFWHDKQEIGGKTGIY